jgi:argininosuccinate lyase
MPQKRNPVALEHTRILASKALAQAQGVFTCTHNTPFTDIVDSEDDLQPLVFGMTTDAHRALRLFSGAMSECEVHVDKLAERANADFLTVTELADTLVREENVSFHAAHNLVSAAVRHLQDRYSPEAMIDAVYELAPQIMARDLKASRSDLLRALDPQWFVSVRSIPGGPSRGAVSDALRDADARQADTQRWINAKQNLLNGYAARIAEARVAETVAPR